MVKSIERYASETIVVVHAKLRKSLKPVKNATIHDYELDIYEVHKVVDIAENVPFSVYDAENINRDKPEEDEADDADESPDDETEGNTPRDSEEWSRVINAKGLDSKSKSNYNLWTSLLILHSQLRVREKAPDVAPTSAIEQPHSRSSHWTIPVYFPNPVRNMQSFPYLLGRQRVY